jgi:hypothetical protein
MRRWGWPVAGVAVGMAIVLFGAQAATGATTKTLSYDAAALIAWDNDSGAQQQFTTHTANGVTPCANPVTIDKADGEGKGALLQFEGGMLFPVQLPDGAKVTRLRLFAVDQDAQVDAYVYLVRKKLQTGVPKDAGYTVMAIAHSTGNVLTNVRKFDDTTITGAIADPTQFAYYLELVSCGITVEPIGIQITTTT